MSVAAAPTLVQISDEVCREVFAPLVYQTVSECADDFRRLPSTDSEPGEFKTHRVPYLRGIMDALDDEQGSRSVVFVKSARVAGTTAGENMILHRMLRRPCGILMVWQTEKALKAWSRGRLTPMLQDSPALARMFPHSSRRDSSDQLARKEFPGGFLQMVTAGSTADARSHTTQVVYCEEVDEYPPDLGEQGDPLGLFRARLRTFLSSNRGLFYAVTTPTYLQTSRGWKELRTSTWNEYWVPCPHCERMQTLRFRDGDVDQEWLPTGEYRLLFDRDEEGVPVKGSCRYVCENGCEIGEEHKDRMLAAGEWRPRYPGRAKIGFHINTLYSPLCPWDEVASEFMQAVRDPAYMKTFVNTMLGLPYAEVANQVDAHMLAGRAEPYLSKQGQEVEVPVGVGLLTAGVDVQGDRIEVYVWGWGARLESWVIEHAVLNGDPTRPEVWRKLRTYLERTFTHASGAPMKIAMAAVDTGHATDRAHGFANAHPRCIPVKGDHGPGKPMLTRPNLVRKFRSSKRPTWMVGGDEIKNELAGRLRTPPPGPATIHFPDGLDSVFYDQLTAERITTVKHQRRLVRTWVCPDGRANEALDCAVYARAALRKLEMDNPRLMATLARRAQELAEWKPEAKPKGKAGPAVQPRPRSFVRNW